MKREQALRLADGLLPQWAIAERAGVSEGCISRRATSRGIVPTAVRWRMRLYTEEQAALLVPAGRRGGRKRT